MKLFTRIDIALIVGLTDALRTHLSENAQIHEVTAKKVTDPAIFNAIVFVAFGPTHKLKFTFNGDVSERDVTLGNKWKLTYQEDGLIAEVSIGAETEGNRTDIETAAWTEMRKTLGV
jgi:hypothetical protein